MTVIEEIAKKHYEHFRGSGPDVLGAQNTIEAALRELLDLCMAEVDDVKKRKRAVLNKCRTDAVALCRQSDIETCDEVKSRLARLGESGERDAK